MLFAFLGTPMLFSVVTILLGVWVVTVAASILRVLDRYLRNTPSTMMMELLSFDIRSLALFRVVLSVTLLVYWSSEVEWLELLYTEDGALPRSLSGNDSLLFMSENPFFHYTVMVIGNLACIGLLLGWHTSVSAAVLLVVLHAKFGKLQQFDGAAGAYPVLAASLVACILCPVSACFSVDNGLRTKVSAEEASAHPEEGLIARDSDTGIGKDNIVYCVGGIYILTELVVLYGIAVLKKTGQDVWISDFSSVSSLLHAYNSGWCSIYLNFPQICSFFSFMTLACEILPFLLLVPFRTFQIRAFMLPILLMMHLAYHTCLNIGPTSIAVIPLLLSLIPPKGWDKYMPKVSSHYVHIYHSANNPLGPPEGMVNLMVELLGVRGVCQIHDSLKVTTEERPDWEEDFAHKLENSDSKSMYIFLVRKMDGTIVQGWNGAKYLIGLSPYNVKRFLTKPILLLLQGLWTSVTCLPFLQRAVWYNMCKIKTERKTWTYYYAWATVVASLLSLFSSASNLCSALHGAEGCQTWIQWHIVPTIQDYPIFVGDMKEFPMKPAEKQAYAGNAVWVVIEGTLADGSQLDLLKPSETPPFNYQKRPSVRGNPMSSSIDRLSITCEPDSVVEKNLVRYLCNDFREDQQIDIKSIEYKRFKLTLEGKLEQTSTSYTKPCEPVHYTPATAPIPENAKKPEPQLPKQQQQQQSPPPPPPPPPPPVTTQEETLVIRPPPPVPTPPRPKAQGEGNKEPRRRKRWTPNKEESKFKRDEDQQSAGERVDEQPTQLPEAKGGAGMLAKWGWDAEQIQVATAGFEGAELKRIAAAIPPAKIPQLEQAIKSGQLTPDQFNKALKRYREKLAGKGGGKFGGPQSQRQRVATDGADGFQTQRQRLATDGADLPRATRQRADTSGGLEMPQRPRMATDGGAATMPRLSRQGTGTDTVSPRRRRADGGGGGYPDGRRTLDGQQAIRRRRLSGGPDGTGGRGEGLRRRPYDGQQRPMRKRLGTMADVMRGAEGGGGQAEDLFG